MANLVAFGKAGSLRALFCGADNRVGLYETDTQQRKRVFVEKNHLAHSYSCFAWSGASTSGGGAGSSSSSGSSSSAKRKSSGGSGEAADDILTIGCSDGTIIVWNLVTGVVERVLGALNETPVPTDIALSNDGKSLFVSSAASVVQYSVKDGALLQSLKAGKHGALKLAMNPLADVVAIASTSVKLIETTSGRRRKLDAHLAGGVGALAFSQCGQFLAVSATGVREVLVFDIQADADGAPLYVHAVDGVPQTLVVRSRPGTGGSELVVVDVFCIFADSGGCVARIVAPSDGAQGDREIEASMALLQSHGALLGAAFSKNSRLAADGASSRDCLSYAVGSIGSPFFGEVNFGAAGDALQSQILLVDNRLPPSSSSAASAASAAASVGAGGADSAALGLVSTLGPNDMGGKKRPAVELETASAKKGKAAGGADDSSAAAAERTIEEMLQPLSASMGQLEQLVTQRPARDAGELAPTSDSLVTLVDQALQTGDDALLEQCLACDDEDVVDATAQRLPVARVVLLLRRLVAKFEKRPSRSQLLTRWLLGLMRHHTAYLFSVPDLSFQMPGLSQILEQRASTYVPLVGLEGRLDLVMAQVSANNKGGAGARSSQPRSVYVEE